jgi:hypothetical protein
MLWENWLCSLGDKLGLFFKTPEPVNFSYLLVLKELTSIRVQKPVLSTAEGLALFFQPQISQISPIQHIINQMSLLVHFCTPYGINYALVTSKFKLALFFQPRIPMA